MNYRRFGNTDLMVSEIGFGAWAIGGGATIGNTVIGWGDADDAISEDAIYAAKEQGINFFDTADIYGLGHSEELLGKTIGNDPDSIIATKVGNVARSEQFTVDYSKNYIRFACEHSLRRLKRDTIDYYQLHSARLTHLQQAECIEAMQELQEQGKIRYWGLSLNSFDPMPEAKWMMEMGIGNGFQLVLNMINQRALSLVKEAAFKGYGIIARMPLQFGLLTGKFDTAISFADNDHRKKRLTREIIDASNKALAPVWELQRLYGASKAQLALGYILSHPQVSTIIPGIRTREQAIENTTGIIPLERQDRDMIDQLGENEMIALMELIQKQG
jgi:aryl-alcohol dehydrogenase-like predicted oxidoreductase